MRELSTDVEPGSALERWLARATAEQKQQRFSEVGEPGHKRAQGHAL